MNNEQQTLRNKIIISARPVTENDTLKQYLSVKGARVIDFPMIEIIPVVIKDKLRNVFSNLNSFHWIVFTSKNGVEYFFKIFKELNHNLNILKSLKIAVVGKSTADEVRKNGLTPFLISSGDTSEDLLKELHSEIQNSIFTVKLLLALGCLASHTIENDLSKTADVTIIDLYKTTEPHSFSADILKKINKNQYNIIIFTSPSQVQNFLKILNRKSKIINHTLRMACIGRTTEKEMLKNDIKPVLVSSKSDSLIFAQEIENYLINNTVH